MLEITLLGGFRVRVDGRAIDRWPRSDARQLLKLLALKPALRLSRERAIAALWPASGTADVDHRLNNAIYTLRSALEPGRPARAESRFVGSGSDWVGLKRDAGIVVDAEYFERWVQAAPDAAGEPESLWHALEAYAGALLPDDKAERWTTAPREHLAALYVHAVRRIADQRIARGEYASTIALLHRWVALMPAEETAHRMLIEALVAAGRPREAQRQYEYCDELLRRELGIEPSPATREALTLTRTHTDHPAPPADAAPATAETANAVERWSVAPPQGALLDREADLAQVLDLFSRNVARIVTLTGPGGVGKTQLALHVAQAARCLRRHGTVCVALDQAACAPAVPVAIGTALAGRDSPVPTTAEQLARFIGRQPLLLILDNAEHVLDEVADLVAQLARGCPALWLLVTSRAPLSLTGEHVVRLRPLRLPAPGERDLQALRSAPAVALFELCVRRGEGGVVLDAQQLPKVAAVCQQLDGLPLAIELAAARMSFFGLHELARRVEQGFDDLQLQRCDTPERHRSLHAVLDWSWQLLPEPAQRLLCVLCLFADGFSLAAAEAVDAQGSDTTTRQLELLVQHHFVQTDTDRIGSAQPGRFGMLRTVRLYAQEQLADRADAPALQRHFALYWARCAEALTQPQGSSGAREAAEAFERERANFEAALACAARVDLSLAYALLGSLAELWGQRGYANLGAHWARAVLDPARSCGSAWQVQALAGASDLLVRCGQLDDAGRFAGAALDGIRTLGLEKPQLVASLRRRQGIVLMRRGAYDESALAFGEALEAAQQGGALADIGSCHATLGAVARYRGAYAEAIHHFGVCLELLEHLAPAVATPVLFNLSLIARLRGDHDRAARLMRRAVDVASASGDVRPLCCILIDDAEYHLLMGRVEAGRHSLRQALAINANAQDPYVSGCATLHLGVADTLERRLDAAREHLQRSAAVLREAACHEQIDVNHLWWARACRLAGDADEAALHIRRIVANLRLVRHYLLPSLLEEGAALLRSQNRLDVAIAVRAEADALRAQHALQRMPAEDDMLQWPSELRAPSVAGSAGEGDATACGRRGVHLLSQSLGLSLPLG